MEIAFKFQPPYGVREIVKLLGARARYAAEPNGTLWLRLPSDHTATIPITLIGERFQLDSETGWLIRDGERIASEKLPTGLNWSNLDESLALQFPVPRLRGELPDSLQVELRLARSEAEVTPCAMVLAAKELVSWCELASEVRLHALVWQCRQDQAIVFGRALPPLRGRFYYGLFEERRDAKWPRILLPVGFRWLPELTASEVCELFEVGEDQILLWEDEREVSFLEHDGFQQMQRSQIRHWNSSLTPGQGA